MSFTRNSEDSKLTLLIQCVLLKNEYGNILHTVNGKKKT